MGSTPNIDVEGAGEVNPTVIGYKWNVNIATDNCLNVGEKLISPIFSVTCDHALKWRIWLYPKGEDESVKDYLSIYIEYKSEFNVTAAIVFCILNTKNERVVQKVSNLYKFTNDLNDTWGFPKFKEQSFVLDEKNEILHNDKLTILCEIIIDQKVTVVGDIQSVGSSPLPKRSNEQQSGESETTECPRRVKEFNDFEKLFESGKYSDLTITSGEKAFHVHKSILSARSTVFDAMIESKVKENDHTNMEITGIKHHVLNELFRFIYSAKVNDIDKLANDLLIASDKYNVKGLKFVCEKILYKNLSLRNAFEYLKLADTSKAPQLKSQAIKYIVPHLEHILDKPDFRLVGELHSDSICDFVRAIILKDKKNS